MEWEAYMAKYVQRITIGDRERWLGWEVDGIGTEMPGLTMAITFWANWNEDTGKRRSRMQGLPVQTSGRTVIRVNFMVPPRLYRR